MINKKIFKYKYKDIFLLIRIWNNLRNKRKYSIIRLLIFQVLSGFLEMLSLASVVPFIYVITNPKNIIDSFIIRDLILIFNIENNLSLITLITIIFILLIIICNGIRLYNLWLTNSIASKITSDFSTKCYANKIYSNYEDHINSNSSDFIALITNYIIKTTDFIYSFLQIVYSLIILFSLVFTLIIYSWKIAFTCLIIFSLFYSLIIIKFKYKLNQNGIEFSKRNDFQIRIIQESLGSIRDIIVNKRYNLFLRFFEKNDRKFRMIIAQNATISGFPKYILEAIGIVFIALTAYLFVITKVNTYYIISLLSIIALGSQKIIPSFQMIFYSWSTMQSSKEVVIKVLRMVEKPRSKDLKFSQNRKFYFNKEIILNNINFKYRFSKSKTLNNINLKIIKGDTVGIIGRTGSGKSTLLDILIGLLTPTSGNLLVDNLDVHKNESLHTWQNMISHVPQNIFLTDSSFIENIAFGIDYKDINIQRVKLVSKYVLLDDFINSLPAGYHTKIGEKGGKLSGGQRQRIGIARALYEQKEILILDEATSSLDSNTEFKIMNRIKNLSNKMTVILITHNENSLNFCNKVFSLSNKEISQKI